MPPRSPPADTLLLPPTTRYLGSKRKLLPWLAEQLRDLAGETVLDAFSGTASVAFLFKSQGRQVTCNDLLHANCEIARALIENPGDTLGDDQLAAVLDTAGPANDGDVITRLYEGVYFLPEENAWLDRVVHNLRRQPDAPARSLAWAALFQACLRKRPYNLFHRSNLSLRTADVPRSFGNKTTWDRPFDATFRQFVQEFNAAVTSLREQAPTSTGRAVCGDVLDVAGEFDIVYLDPPYLKSSRSVVEYGDFYHFLDGLLAYDAWPTQIDAARRHRPFVTPASRWARGADVLETWRELLARHPRATWVVSYRSDGYPAAEDLERLLRTFKRRVRCTTAGRYQYALSPNARSQELLFIAQ